MTQEELDELVAAAAPEPADRIQARREAQRKLGRLWDAGEIEFEQGTFKYCLAKRPA